MLRRFWRSSLLSLAPLTLAHWANFRRTSGARSGRQGFSNESSRKQITLFAAVSYAVRKFTPSPPVVHLQCIVVASAMKHSAPCHLAKRRKAVLRALQKGEAMPSAMEFEDTVCFFLPAPDLSKKRNAQRLSTEGFRQILSDLNHRPASQRAVLRKLWHRALQNGASTKFPVASHVVPDPVTPS